MTMKAMVLEKTAPIGEAPLNLQQIPVPEPGEGEVLVAIHCCGICRTDLHIVEGDLPESTRPIVPGHQIVGTTKALGPGCRHARIGQRVGIAWLRHTCGQCDFCRRGQENLCEASRFTGYHAHGGYAEYALIHEDFLYDIPDAFSEEEAAPLLCGGIIGYRSLQRANVPEGGALALYGFGSSAHIVLQLAKHRGHRVFAVSRTTSHQRLALDMGADWAGDDPSLMPEKADSAIVFAPAGPVVPPALAALRNGGTLAVAGIHLSDIPPLNYEKHLFYERDLRSVTANTWEDGRGLLDEAARIPIRPQTTTYPLEEANQALQDLAAGAIDGTGILRVR